LPKHQLPRLRYGLLTGPDFASDHENFDDLALGQGGFRMELGYQGRDSITLQGDLYKAGRASKNLASITACVHQRGWDSIRIGRNILEMAPQRGERQTVHLQDIMTGLIALGSQLGAYRATPLISIFSNQVKLFRPDISGGWDEQLRCDWI